MVIFVPHTYTSRHRVDLTGKYDQACLLGPERGAPLVEARIAVLESSIGPLRQGLASFATPWPPRRAGSMMDPNLSPSASGTRSPRTAAVGHWLANLGSEGTRVAPSGPGSGHGGATPGWSNQADTDSGPGRRPGPLAVPAALVHAARCLPAVHHQDLPHAAGGAQQ
eukprot:gene10639-1934_t